jgi:superfamily II DNA helicase RecQ
MRCKIFSFPVESEELLDRERDMNDFLDATNVKRVFASIASQPEGPVWSVLFFFEDAGQIMQKSHARADAAMDPWASLTREQARSIIALKKWRTDQAAVEGVPLYLVAQNKWLEEIVRMPVRNLEDLAKVQGLGEWRVQKYGAKILEVLDIESAARHSRTTSNHPSGRA